MPHLLEDYVGCPLPPEYTDISTYVSNLCLFIDEYKSLIDIHIVDFLTKNQWELLPNEWREILLPNNITNEDEWWSSLIHVSTAADLSKVRIFSILPTFSLIR